MYSETNEEWYNSLNTSPLTPPNYLFGIVWPILYVMIIISGIVYFIQPQTNLFTIAISIYVLQWILNIVWSPLFFKYRQITASFIVITLLLVVIGINISIFGETSILSAILLVPYFIWVLFASYLNGYIWYNN